MAIIVVKIMLLFFSNSVMIIHFGMNPVRGGRPPKDMRVTDIINNIVGVLFHKSEARVMDVRE